MRISRLIAAVIAATLFVEPAQADTFGTLSPFDIEFVTIGNPGNADDTTGVTNHPAGKVDYNYRISKYEISEAMIDAAGLGIAHDGRGANKPATSVTWYDVAKFTNWLNTSKGHQAAYNFDGDGNFQLWSSAEAWQSGGENLFRHKDSVYFLPSMDEWHKAAYYDPTSGLYYDYPTGSDTAPTAIASGTTAGTAVYNQSSATGPADITQAGGLSPYGTMGQGGNVSEWEETEQDLVNDSSGRKRAIRGGWWRDSDSVTLMSSFRGNFVNPAFGLTSNGFRVASTVPEPTAALFLCGSGALARLRRRRRR